MRLLALLLVFTLAGCEQDKGSDRDLNYYDFEDQNTGLRLVNDSIYGRRAPEEAFIEVWNTVQTCSGLSTYPAPYIVVVDLTVQKKQGVYYVADKVIEIEFSANPFETVLAHEMLHYLAHKNQVPVIVNHGSEIFERCAPNT